MNSELKNITITEWCGNTMVKGEHVEISFRMDESGAIKAFSVELLNDEHEHRIFGEEEYKEFSTMMTILNGERLRCAVKIARETIGKQKER
jgi:hypothetical protein